MESFLSLNIPQTTLHEKPQKVKPIWNLNKKGGWESYFFLTDGNRKMINMIEDESDPDVVNDQINRELERI